MYNFFINKKGVFIVDEKIVEKFKDTEFLKKIIVLPDEEKVKEEFKKEGIEVEDKDLKEIGDLIKCSVEVVSNLSSEELEKVSSGYKDGAVDFLSVELSKWAVEKHHEALDGSFSKKFYDKLEDHSDKVVEAGLASMVAGLSIGGTLGMHKLIKTGKEKGWWTKDYWIKKK